MSNRATLTTVLVVTCGLMHLSCRIDPSIVFYNNTSSLGGNSPGSRGSVQVQFINQTPYRAIFTYGSFDQQDQEFVFDAAQTTRQLGQFVANPDSTNVLQASLEGNTTSAVITLQCARTLAVGTAELLEAIRDSDLSIELDPDALFVGVGFSDKPLSDPDAGVPTFKTSGTTVYQGYDFQCGRTPTAPDDSPGQSLVVFTFVQDDADPSGFRTDVQVILP